MVYSVDFTPLENFFVTIEDRNIGRSLGDYDEDAHITYIGHEPRGTIDPLKISKPAPRIIEFGERQGN